MEQISSPEQLSDYLQVTNPGVWTLLIAILVLLTGFLVWAMAGTIETTVEATAVVDDGMARVVTTGNINGEISTGMPVRILKEEGIVSQLDTDEYGRGIALTEIELPDGTYDAQIVTEQIHPITFLLGSR